MKVISQPSTPEMENSPIMEHVDGITPRRRRVHPLPYVLLVPAILALGLMLGYPIIRLVTLSLQEFGLKQQFGAAADWVGLDNFRDILHDAEFWAVLRRTLIFCVVNVVVDHHLRNADRAAAEAARPEDAAADDDRPDACVGDAGTDQHGDLAMDLRHAVRDRQLGCSTGRASRGCRTRSPSTSWPRSSSCGWESRSSPSPSTPA